MRRAWLLVLLCASAASADPIAGESRRHALLAAVDYFEMKLQKSVDERDDIRRATLLREAASAAFYAGELALVRDHTSEMLVLAAGMIDDDAKSDTEHAAHILRGKLALEDNRVEVAAKELLAAADVEGSPALGANGPDFTLAEALIVRGRRADVQRYLAHVARFWHEDRGCALFWHDELAADIVPDFSARYSCDLPPLASQ